jgi:geranylgeranyl diphosphate synthase type I
MTHEATSTAPNIPPALFEVVHTGVNQVAETLRAGLAGEHPHVAATVESYLSLLEGGKGLRGVLAVTSYEASGGTDPKVAATVAGVVEAVHASLLVPDDIADSSHLRRGRPTAHIRLRDYFGGQQMMEGDVAKLGIDTAANAAQYAQQRTERMLLGLKSVPLELRVLAMEVLKDGLALTGLGQALDIILAYSSDASREDILEVATRKTAFYSFLLPLQLGAALAGAPREELERFTEYSLNAGLAFQLYDDVMGLFGSEAVTGKPRMSDMQEGKKTLLMLTALENAGVADRGVLLSALGNPDLTEDHFEQCLDIIRSTGTLQEVRGEIALYVARACDALVSAPAYWPASHVQLLRDLAQFGANRES